MGSAWCSSELLSATPPYDCQRAVTPGGGCFTRTAGLLLLCRWTDTLRHEVWLFKGRGRLPTIMRRGNRQQPAGYAAPGQCPYA